jgi:HTH-type transcriptional regulator / antitoxin HipB
VASINNQRALGAAVRDRRHSLGWTQAALAGKVGVTRDWVIAVEAGKGNPQLRRLLRALDALGLRLAVEHDVDEPDTPEAQQRSQGRHPRVDGDAPVVDLDQVLEDYRRRG